MKISVITVCMNSAATIGHALKSFVGQDYPDKELIVVDGASTDDTLKIVRSFESEGVRVFPSQMMACTTLPTKDSRRSAAMRLAY